MKKLFTPISAFLLLFFSCGNPGDLSVSDNRLEFEHQGERISLEVISDDIIHITASPSDWEPVTRRLVVGDIARNGKMKVSVTDRAITVSTSKVRVEFGRGNGTFAFFDARSGRCLLSEKEEAARSYSPRRIRDGNALQVMQRFNASHDEAFYGLGQYQTGAMNYRGDTVVLVQANMEIANPYLVSTEGYGLFWENYSATLFIDDEEGFRFESEIGDGSDYWFIYGGDIEGSIAGFRRLTGRVPMLPLSAFGFWQSRERYKSFEELTAVVEEYRHRGIPLDNIVQDWEYWGDKPYWNSLKFNGPEFADAEKHIARLHDELSVRYTLSVWPGFGPRTDIYRALESAGALFDESTWAGYKIFDVYNPAARDTVWNHLYDGLYSKGVDGWWLDSSEPSFGESFTQVTNRRKVEAAGMTHYGDMSRYLNVYSLELTRDFHDRLRRVDKDRRVTILTRSAFAGQQAFGTMLWSGDVSATWEVMRRQIPAGVNLSMSGFPYWCSDIGGFFVTHMGGAFPDGLDDDEYKELYTRWFQMVAFNPIFRAHGSDLPREVWQFGQPGTPYYEAQLDMIRLRYRLMPYIYSLASRVWMHDETMMRGLVMDFPQDPVARNVDNQYMFGSRMMVCPVTAPGRTSEIYLPGEGESWYDFWSGERLQGGKAIVREVPLDVIPLYLRAGTIIPMGQVKQYAGEKGKDDLEIRVYRGRDASFEIYEDAGDGYGYTDGEYSLIPLVWNDKKGTLTVGTRKGTFPGMAAGRNIRVVCYHADGNVSGVEAHYNGKQTVLKL